MNKIGKVTVTQQMIADAVGVHLSTVSLAWDRSSDRWSFSYDVLMDDQVIASMQGEPWASFELSDERVLALGDGAALVAYRGRARRGEVDYTALFNSTYVRVDGDWRMALHQQTPI